MNNRERTALVPKLRFPEFFSTGEWQKYRLDEIADRITEKVGYKDLTTLSISAGIGFVSQVEKFSRDISGKQYENYIHLRKGDFSYNKGNSKKFPQGCIYELKEYEEAAVPNAFISFHFNDDYVSSFYKGYFDNNFHGKQLARFITSGARSDGLLNISPTNFFSIILPTPKEKDEQQKIADCLSSLNDLITAEGKKLEALKAHKKGLMRKLFPTEGKTVPEWRFPEYRGEWEERKLGDVCTSIFSGKSKKSTKNEIFPLIGSTGQIGFCDTADYSGELILIARVGANAGQVNFYTGKCGVSDNTLILNVNTANIIGIFLRKWLDNFNINKLIFGSGQPLVTGGQLKNIDICIPRLTEQQKIADFLSALDTLITAQAEKIKTLKLHKKGLMQGLFPSIEEVSE